MTSTGIDGLENTIHKTNEWLNDIMEEEGWTDKNKAYLALRSTLHALRDRLVVEEAIDLGAQLPLLIRGLYYEGYTVSGKPDRSHTKDEFFSLIRKELERTPDIDAEEAARGVFSVLRKKVSKGEINDIQSMLPKEVQELWH